VFRDEKGFFVGSFAANDNFIDLERGKTSNIDPQTFFGGGAFNEITIGAIFKVPVPKPLNGLIQTGAALRRRFNVRHRPFRRSGFAASIHRGHRRHSHLLKLRHHAVLTIRMTAASAQTMPTFCTTLVARAKRSEPESQSCFRHTLPFAG